VIIEVAVGEAVVGAASVVIVREIGEVRTIVVRIVVDRRMAAGRAGVAIVETTAMRAG
jgi:hypothetical protein